MTANPIPVKAQWALHGKNADNEGYRILAYSIGDLSKENFTDALNRFRIGAVDKLPQVSVSYARHGTRPGASYLALAIHWFAEDGQRLAAGVRQFDVHGRATAFTSYFCAPYLPLASHAITYQSMYEAFSGLKLPVENGSPMDVELEAPVPQTPAIDDLAMRVAALLLTGTPVCVLGAELTRVDERLRFIDTVMALLPYGFRTRMTAATWTRATYREHRFRLFFSSAPRTVDQADHVVYWGDPDVGINLDGPAGEYFDWLEDKIGPLTRLPELTTEIGFGPKAAIQALELVDGAKQRSRPAPRQKDRRVPAPVPPGPPRPALTEGDFAEKTLRECAEDASKPNLARLRTDISALKRFAESADGTMIDGDRRERYQRLIGQYGLLRHNFLLEKRAEKYEDRLYDALLALGFGMPLGYDGYCRLEECLGIKPGTPPHGELLDAIERGGMADPLVAAIVYWHLRQAREKSLDKWLLSGQLDVVAMIRLLAEDWKRPQHARIACDITLHYLLKARYEPQAVRQALRQHGFLAHALSTREPGNHQYQVSALYRFLKAAYPGGIGRAAIVQILMRSTNPPTPALLAAVMMQVSRPGEWQLASEAYIYGSLTLMNVDPPTSARLLERAPVIDAAAINGAEPPQPG